MIHAARKPPTATRDQPMPGGGVPEEVGQGHLEPQVAGSKKKKASERKRPNSPVDGQRRFRVKPFPFFDRPSCQSSPTHAQG